MPTAKRPYTRPVVDGKQTDLATLAIRLGVSVRTAQVRYHACVGRVTMRALRALDRERAARAKRDRRIVNRYLNHGKLLREAGSQHGLSAQRVHQIVQRELKV